VSSTHVTIPRRYDTTYPGIARNTFPMDWLREVGLLASADGDAYGFFVMLIVSKNTP
jgi:hypothetical protein